MNRRPTLAERLERAEGTLYQMCTNWIALYWLLKDKGLITDEELDRRIQEVHRLRATVPDYRLAERLRQSRIGDAGLSIVHHDR